MKFIGSRYGHGFGTPIELFIAETTSLKLQKLNRKKSFLYLLTELIKLAIGCVTLCGIVVMLGSAVILKELFSSVEGCAFAGLAVFGADCRLLGEIGAMVEFCCKTIGISVEFPSRCTKG